MSVSSVSGLNKRLALADRITTTSKLCDMLGQGAGEQRGRPRCPTRPELVNVVAELIADLAWHATEQVFQELR